MSDVRLVATNPDDNTLVPVASNSSGQLAVQSPKIEKVPNDFEVEGNLTVSGNAIFADDGNIIATRFNTLTVGRGAGDISSNTVVGNSAFFSNITGDENTVVGRSALAKNTEGSNNTAIGRLALQNNVSGSNNTAIGRNAGQRFLGSNNTILGTYGGNAADELTNDTVIICAGSTERMRIDADGIATFLGDVVVGSRNKQWMLVEQGGLCHMVEQISASTSDLVNPDLVDPDFAVPVATSYPKLRDVFAELDVVEKALEQVMEKLRMVEPDGWPVWDGSSNP